MLVVRFGGVKMSEMHRHVIKVDLKLRVQAASFVSFVALGVVFLVACHLMS